MLKQQQFQMRSGSLMNNINYVLSVFCLLSVCLDTVTAQSMSSMKMLRSNNLTAITWAHAVNSQSQLTDTLNSNVNMIEADIVLGQVFGNDTMQPIMAHPPATTSDLSLDGFLKQIAAYNLIAADKKGVKLDFKSIEVFEGSLVILQRMLADMNCEIWLNADIVRGPVNQTEVVPVDADRFFAGCKYFPNAVLSIGWTTRWGANYNDGKGAYTTEQIDNMIKAIKRNNVTATAAAITFPVRAGIAANSQAQLHSLVQTVNKTCETTLTIWSSQNDFVNIDRLRKLIYSFGLDRVYLDVPADVANKLNLKDNASNNSATMSTLCNFSLISAGLLLISLWMYRKTL